MSRVWRQHPGATPLAYVGERLEAMAVYDCVANARRAYVVAQTSMIPDITAQIEELFGDSFDARSTVMLESLPPDAAGSPGPPAPPSARITADADHEVTVANSAADAGGYLVLLDSLDRGWRVPVDGQPAVLLRANALYRAVHISPGPHTVVFKYRPRAFCIWLILSILTAVSLAIVAARRPARTR